MVKSIIRRYFLEIDSFFGLYKQENAPKSKLKNTNRTKLAHCHSLA